MIVSFVSPTTAWPGGGVLGIIEFANGLARRGHEVHVVHVPFVDRGISRIEELDWCPVEDALVHHFMPGEFDPEGCPRADVGLSFDHRLPAHGLPATFFQAFGILGSESETRILATSGPLICTSSWLRSVAIDHGVEPARAWHLPYGLRREKYRLTTPIEDRRPVVSLLFNDHPLKAGSLGVRALETAKERVPELEAIVFGTQGPPPDMPRWMQFLDTPSQPELIDEVYNRSRVFISCARREGFGLAAIESMACGAALVTTDNGGSWDYAADGETALVVEPGDVGAMAAAIVALVGDDQRRVALARRGRSRALRFDWDSSAARLESLLEGYIADPRSYRRIPDPA